jgi:hypothetical protein
MAFYLNAVLPYNLPHKYNLTIIIANLLIFFFFLNYSKFCSQTIKQNEKHFTNAVAKLNVNIIYLSLYQHVPVTNLLPKHTLENLYYFVNYINNMEIRTREK